MIGLILASAVLLALPLGAAISMMIAEAKLNREERLRAIEAELKALKASMPPSGVSEIDHLVAAFAMGAAFATRSVERPRAERSASSAEPSATKTGINGGETVATTAATTAAL